MATITNISNVRGLNGETPFDLASNPVQTLINSNPIVMRSFLSLCSCQNGCGCNNCGWNCGNRDWNCGCQNCSWGCGCNNWNRNGSCGCNCNRNCNCNCNGCNNCNGGCNDCYCSDFWSMMTSF
ncbi:MAG: hypothetical protein K2G37_00635 [Clostridia bacterium]|nr:hypothetical protein [Clostridia bacterium]MDE7328513.1 hypothetical protein [Clostridia bacterium]